MDAAFKTAAYPAYTIEQLEAFLSGTGERGLGEETVAKMRAEIERREKVAAGDKSVMTAGERLRHVRESETAPASHLRFYLQFKTSPRGKYRLSNFPKVYRTFAEAKAAKDDFDEHGSDPCRIVDQAGTVHEADPQQ